MFSYPRQYAQVTLDSSGVVITDVALNHLHEFLFAGETLAVIAFPFQNAPESFHDTELVVSDPERIYDVYHWKPQIGDTVTFNFKNHSGKTITKAFKIGAITSSNDGMSGYIFRMPENMLKELAGYDCTYAIEIQAEAEYQEIIEQELEVFVSDNRDVRLQTIQDFIVEHQSDNRAGFTLAYAIAAILWIFAVINQINLTVTNLLSLRNRKWEH